MAKSLGFIVYIEKKRTSRTPVCSGGTTAQKEKNNMELQNRKFAKTFNAALRLYISVSVCPFDRQSAGLFFHLGCLVFYSESEILQKKDKRN